MQLLPTVDLCFAHLRDVGAPEASAMPPLCDPERAPRLATYDALKTRSSAAGWGMLSPPTAQAGSWDDVKKYLATRGPLVFEIVLHKDFMRCDVGADYAGPTEPPFKGTHALACIGYDDGHRVDDALVQWGGWFTMRVPRVVPSFLFVNSWGMRWGEEGKVWIPYKTLEDPNFLQAVYALECPSGVTPEVDPVGAEDRDWPGDADPWCFGWVLEIKRKVSAGAEVEVTGPIIPATPAFRDAKTVVAAGYAPWANVMPSPAQVVRRLGGRADPFRVTIDKNVPVGTVGSVTLQSERIPGHVHRKIVYRFTVSN
jgi:hypothetical protein